MLRLSEHLRTTYTTDGAIVLDTARGRIFRFNPTGSRILHMVEAGAVNDEIVSALIREFSADPATAESDISKFLAVLEHHALVEFRVAPEGKDRTRCSC
jgi:hypothetical protein